MANRKLILGSLLAVFLLGIGFVFGAAFALMRVDEAHRLELIAQLKRQDSVMRLLRRNDLEGAADVQMKYLSATIYQLQSSRQRLPEDVMQLIAENQGRKPAASN